MIQNRTLQAIKQLVKIPVGNITLEGDLVIPPQAKGIVLFAHGSGSSRHSPRNMYVAEILQEKGLATLLIDLLTMEEDKLDNVTREYRFNINMLAERLAGITDWLKQNPITKELHVGYFGASTGAGAALIAASRRPKIVEAIVSRGGRADLAGSALKDVHVPTILIVGSYDYTVIRMNEDALKQIPAVKKLEIVQGATHLFEEPGTLETAAKHASNWLIKYLDK